ncbi:phytanoyl-coa dioxygenase 1-like [Plakobranchus ocellatus]|uniref:Phytanoyl-coa dioxygenase 1-like n=1 Tax=Plakobranchus ocellatus TaxID=259542 RepID=A0AAV4BZL4_9GAST|nr:phytanoyl-coa dioxygenase 1-like [Plakobranchus ocellatus]
MSHEDIYPGHCTKGHPEVFNIEAMPEQPTVTKPGHVSRAEIERYFKQGYLVVEDFFLPEELDPCLSAIEGVVDKVASALFRGGKIKDVHADLNVFQRLTELDKDFPGALILTHKDGVLPPAFADLWANPRLLNFMEQILGPCVYANPIWNVRPKGPSVVCPDGDIPWHQDAGYFDPASYATMIPVVWVPLLDTTTDNGCLQIVEGGHKNGMVCDHLNCFANTWHIMMDESKVEKTLGVNLEKNVKTLPIKKGSFIVFNNLVPHRSLPNKTNQIRWSLDLRYQKPGLPEGLYGELPTIALRDPATPNLKVDWSPYTKIRHLHQHMMTCGKEAPPPEMLDTTLTGPWMKQWPLVHGNRHTEAAGLVPLGQRA